MTKLRDAATDDIRLQRERDGVIRCIPWFWRICNDLRMVKNKCRNLHFAVDITAYVMQSLRMTTNTTETVKIGKTTYEVISTTAYSRPAGSRRKAVA